MSLTLEYRIRYGLICDSCYLLAWLGPWAAPSLGTYWWHGGHNGAAGEARRARPPRRRGSTTGRQRTPSHEGRLAAADLALRVATHPITAIYSSPYRRAVETVEPLAAQLKLEIRLHEDLAERWLADRILADHEWLDVFRRTWQDIDFRPHGGESRRTTQDRALAALEDLLQQHPDEMVVASTHGGLLGCLLRALDGQLSFDEALSMPMPSRLLVEKP